MKTALFDNPRKSLSARCGAEPSAEAHFQFIIEEKSSDKHKRLSAGKATVQHNRNSKATRKREVTEVSGTNQNYTNTREQLSPQHTSHPSNTWLVCFLLTQDSEFIQNWRNTPPDSTWSTWTIHALTEAAVVFSQVTLKQLCQNGTGL